MTPTMRCAGLALCAAALTFARAAWPATPLDAAQAEVEHATVMVVCANVEEHGVGLIVATDAGRAYIATAGHVVLECMRTGEGVTVMLAGATAPIPAQVLRQQMTPLDLAVLSIDAARLRAPAAVLPVARLGDPDSLSRGDALYAIGHAWFSNVTPELLARRDGATLQFETHSVQPGSSGGPLVNDRWQVVGLVRSIDIRVAEAIGIDAVLATLTQWQVPLALRRLPVVSAGDERSCTLTRAGDVRCWSDAAIGHATVPPGDLETHDGLRLQSISVGLGHTCGLDAGGAAYCWGLNVQGQLGRGSTSEDSDEPERVSGTSRFSAISAGGWHSCALTLDGQAYCWGAGSEGRLGNDSGADSAVPVRVSGVQRYRSISAGARNSCAIAINGEAWCWGGVMGSGLPRAGSDPPNAFVPQRVPGGASFVAISAGGVDSQTCALSAEGAVTCWGEADEKVSTAQSLRPRRLAAAPPFVSLHRGIGDHGCALTADGRAYCWGRNDEGQLGDGTTARRSTPVAVTGGLRFASVSAGHFQSCGVTTDGRLWCWGARGGDTNSGNTKPTEIRGVD